jgi:hypothetical protein
MQFGFFCLCKIFIMLDDMRISLLLFVDLVTFDVFFVFLFQAPLAVYDDDTDIDKNYLKKVQRLFTINRSSRSKQNHHSNENQDTETNNDHQRFHRRKKSPPIVVPNSTLNLMEKKSNARIVRIRLVFINIGKRKSSLDRIDFYRYVNR